MRDHFVCPYNSCHVMKITRAHQHMINCRKAHIHLNFRICSFNALHHYPAEDEADHMANCSSRIVMTDSTCLHYKGMNQAKKGNLTMPPPPVIHFEDEDWDSS